MKILLTSDGLTSERIRKEFIHLFEKETSENKVLIIHAAQSKEDLGYLEEVGKELEGVGIPKENFTYIDLRENVEEGNEKEFDIIYFCGGNTYYLLDRIRKTKIDKLITQLVNKNKIYIGVSAGSIIVGEDIEIAGWGSEGDPNEINLQNLEGLGFTDIAIFPHYKDELKQEVEEFRNKVNYPVEELKDSEAILILNGNVKKIK